MALVQQDQGGNIPGVVWDTVGLRYVTANDPGISLVQIVDTTTGLATYHS